MTGLRQHGKIYRPDATDEHACVFDDALTSLGSDECHARPPHQSRLVRLTVLVDEDLREGLASMADSMRVLPGAMQRVCLQIGLDAVRGRIDGA